MYRDIRREIIFAIRTTLPTLKEVCTQSHNFPPGLKFQLILGIDLSHTLTRLHSSIMMKMMKFRGPFFLSVVGLFVLAASYLPSIPNAKKEAVLMQVVVRGLGQYHYDPPAINDAFSRQVFDYYLDALDRGRRILTQEDIRAFNAYRNRIDNEASQGSSEFFNLTESRYRDGLEKTQRFYRDILSESFDFDKPETIKVRDADDDFLPNDAALQDYWKKFLKYEVLQRYDDKLQTKQDDPESEEAQKSEAELEAEARQEVLELFDRIYKNLLGETREELFSRYVNAITGIFDPHTQYFSPRDKETFEIGFTGTLEGIGAQLTNGGDYTKVSSIVVGGPAWKGKELEENDLIIGVAQGQGEFTDIKGMKLDDVVQQIRGKKGTVVRLKIRKPDNTQETISITRDVVILEESFAKSLILEGTTEEEKVGYISLPRFYADWNDRNGRNCARDVANEISKLKEEDIDGLILDLRNNGGGSLSEVIKMTGLFIEEGPVVQVKSRNRQPEVMTDSNQRVHYSGPLVILVNQFSASASEIIAAALQDYGRAVIVGSSSTFGKGTVQRFVNLDQMLPGFQEVKPLGDVKMTTQKFYRINGGSTQLRGVRPDVVLPDNFYYIELGEREEDYAMEWSEIAPVDYNQDVFQVRNVLPMIKQRSEARIAQDPKMQKVLKNAERLKRQRDNDRYPLDYTAFQEWEARIEEEAKQYDNIFDDVVNPDVLNLEVDLENINLDEGRSARNNDFKKSVSKDSYIREAVNIVHDLITLDGRLGSKD